MVQWKGTVNTLGFLPQRCMIQTDWYTIGSHGSMSFVKEVMLMSITTPLQIYLEYIITKQMVMMVVSSLKVQYEKQVVHLHGYN